MCWCASARARSAGPTCTCSMGAPAPEPGLVIGHEPLGVLEPVGEKVSLVKQGDRVVIPTHLFCEECYNCVRGYSIAQGSPSSARGERRRSPPRPWATFFDKGVSVLFGRTHDRRYTTRALYNRFDSRVDGVVKPIMRPNDPSRRPEPQPPIRLTPRIRCACATKLPPINGSWRRPRILRPIGLHGPLGAVRGG